MGSTDPVSFGEYMKLKCKTCKLDITTELEMIQCNLGESIPKGRYSQALMYYNDSKSDSVDRMHSTAVNERNLVNFVKLKAKENHYQYTHEIGCSRCMSLIGFKLKLSKDILLGSKWVE